MRRLNILVFVDSDLLVRHFLDSRVLDTLIQRHDVQLVLPPVGYRRLLTAVAPDSWGMAYHHVAISEQRRHIWRRLFFVDQARLRLGPDWASIRRGWRALVGWKAALQFSLCALPGIRQIVCAAMRAKLARHPADQFEALLDAQKPDILIHPSTFDGYFINDVIASAQRRGLPSMLLMNSWDNPTLKRAAVGRPTAVTVWGEQSRTHSVHFMNMPAPSVHVLGAAQFDLFRDPPDQDRDAICREHGLDPADRILLYAGSSKGNREATHLRWLSEAITRGELTSTAILYRPHPFGLDAEAARDILENTPPYVHIETSMRPMLERLAAGERGGFFITPYSRTHALLSAIDALVSPLSTIILEGGLHGKPVMCFIPWEEDVDSIWKKFRNLIYFRELLESPGIIVALSHDAFLPAIASLMDKVGDPAYACRVQKAMGYFVDFPPERFGAGLVALTERLAAQSEMA